MSKYDYDDTPPPPPKPPMRLDLCDMMSILALLMTLCIGAYFVTVFALPYAS